MLWNFNAELAQPAWKADDRFQSGGSSMKSSSNCIYCAGAINDVHEGRYRMKTSIAGEYTLIIDELTVNDSGIYKCVDAAGLAVVSAQLFVIERQKHHRPMSTLVDMLSWWLSELHQ